VFIYLTLGCVSALELLRAGQVVERYIRTLCS